jgi:bacterioferritin-associated ferredoxin
MILCSCNVISDRDVRQALAGEACRPSVGALFRSLDREAKCGRCAKSVAAAIEGNMAAAPSCDAGEACSSCAAGNSLAA